MSKRSWNQVIDPTIPWMPRFNELMTLSALPSFTGRTIYITSDFSGHHRDSEYEVFSFLVVDLDNSTEWEQYRRIVRNQFLPDARIMSFKNLNDKYRLRALVPFLQSSNVINGLCLNIAVRKNKSVRYIDKRRLLLLKEKSPFTSNWPYKELDKLFKIAHVVSILIAGFSKPKQNIYWISDQDSLFANPGRAQDVSKLLSALTDIYVKHDLGQLGIGTTSVDEGDRLEEDFAAIPDLAAGGLSECLNALCQMCGGKIAGGLAYPIPQNITQKTALLISWIMDNTHQLKKVVLLFESGGDDRFGITRLQFE